MRLVTRFRWTRWLPLLVVAAAGLAACGGGTEAASEVATLTDESAAGTDAVLVDPDEVDTSEALLEFAACMRENGIEMADPTFDADGNVEGFGPGADGQNFDRRSEEYQAAFETCGDLAEGADFGGNRRGGFDQESIQVAFNSFTSCLRDEGVQVDDITVGGRGAGANAGEDTGAGQAPAEGAEGNDGGFAGRQDGGGPPDGGPGGEGFDPTARLIQQLDLDEEDPVVMAAVETCQPVLEDAFTAATDDTDA